ncbi:hypothetical protein, partial [Rhodoferax sp.]|uniref:hypothetical protein n=1 Tax=Rhodoferax sp. TaxID=50421 RepID=UPI00374D4394
MATNFGARAAPTADSGFAIHQGWATFARVFSLPAALLRITLFLLVVLETRQTINQTRHTSTFTGDS